MSIKIAVGSSDGKVVNAHFGRAAQFLIFQYEDTDLTYLETRVNKPGCSSLNAPIGTMAETIELLRDCHYILVSQIGKPMVERLASQDITACCIPDFIDDALQQLVDTHL